MNAILRELTLVADARQREVLMRFFKTGEGDALELEKCAPFLVRLFRKELICHHFGH